VRGPEHNGRSSLLAALARREGRQALFIDWPLPNTYGGLGTADAPAWLGAFATLADARPILRLHATPGERLRLPRLAGYRGWLGIVCGDEDAIDEPPHRRGSCICRCPTRAARASADRRRSPAPGQSLAMTARPSCRTVAPVVRPPACERWRRASTPLAPAPRRPPQLREVALAGGSAELDSLARLDTRGADWQRAGARRRTAARPRHPRSALPPTRPPARNCCHAAFAARLNAGVRALLAGPSGTGKTFAALVLAERLGVPLYRLDLSSVVSKYIGETERNLHRLLAAAEALDVMLLLDEGDALLARRTRSATPTTATPISKPTSCCSGWRVTAAWCWSRPTRSTASTPPSCAASTCCSTSACPSPTNASTCGTRTCPPIIGSPRQRWLASPSRARCPAGRSATSSWPLPRHPLAHRAPGRR
jgi:hypothetical protein